MAINVDGRYPQGAGVTAGVLGLSHGGCRQLSSLYPPLTISHHEAMHVNHVLRASRLTFAPGGEHAPQTQQWSRPRMEGNSENLHSLFPKASLFLLLQLNG